MTHSLFLKIFRSSSDGTAPQAPGKKQPLRLLLAEDNAVNRKIALLQLERLGYAADTVENGVEALRAIRSKRYDAVLMDCQMPVMDGYEATREIRRTHPFPIRIIAITANAMEEDRQKCLEAGMDDYIAKPVEPEILNRILSEVPARESDDFQSKPADKSAVDFARLDTITQGDRAMWFELFEDYLSQANEIFSQLETAIASCDSDRVREARS